jgi:hypothetical protein
LRCSGTHLREWTGHPPTGRRFRDVDEIYIVPVSGGKLAAASGVEDNLARMRQLGLNTGTQRAPGRSPAAAAWLEGRLQTGDLAPGHTRRHNRVSAGPTASRADFPDLQGRWTAGP